MSSRHQHGGSASKRNTVKSIMIGQSGVGKTSIVQRISSNRFSHRYKCTIGVDFFSINLEPNGEQVTLQQWDTSGQERFVSLGMAYYRGAEIVLLVYDVTNRESFDQLIRTWIPEVRDKSVCHPEDTPIRCILLGSKRDLAEESEDKQQVSYDDGQELAYALGGALFQEVSAKEDDADSFKYLIKRCLETDEGMINVSSLGACTRATSADGDVAVRRKLGAVRFPSLNEKIPRKAEKRCYC